MGGGNRDEYVLHPSPNFDLFMKEQGKIIQNISFFNICCPRQGTLADAGDGDGGVEIVGRNQFIPHK